MSKFGAAIIGCGRVAGIKDQPRAKGDVTTHAQAYYRHPAFELIAACDSRPDQLTAFLERWHISGRFADVATLAAEIQPEVVSICSPTEEHYRQAMTLLDGPAPPRIVFVEKPVCRAPEELNRLQHVAHEAGVTVLVNHTRRFDPGHRRVAELIQGGRLGELVRGRCDYYGGWLHNGTHLIDTLRMLFGVESSIASVAPGAPGKPDDPCWDVKLQIGGAPVELVGFDEDYYQLFEIDLRFENGRVLLRDFGAQIVVETMQINNIGEQILAPFEDAPWYGLDSPLYHALNAIARHLQGESVLAKTGATLDDAGKTMSLLWQVLKQGLAQ